MNEMENEIPSEARDFKSGDTSNDQDKDQSFQHPDAGKPPVSPEERQRIVDEYKKKSKEAENEKEKRWFELKAEVELIVDGLGKGIDDGIKEGVTALMALDFPTDGSCDGHGISGPWVDVYAPEPDGWRESEEKRQEWREANTKERIKMDKLLEEFYKNREVPNEVMLILEKRGFEAFRLQSNGYEDLVYASKHKEQSQEKAKKFKEEMDKFIEFLKEKYFN